MYLDSVNHALGLPTLQPRYPYVVCILDNWGEIAVKHSRHRSFASATEELERHRTSLGYRYEGPLGWRITIFRLGEDGALEEVIFEDTDIESCTAVSRARGMR